MIGFRRERERTGEVERDVMRGRDMAIEQYEDWRHSASMEKIELVAHRIATIKRGKKRMHLE